MKSLVAGPSDQDKRIDKYLEEQFPSLSFGLLQKTFRKKDVKVNGVRVKHNFLLVDGDVVEIYISDEFLNNRRRSKPIQTEKFFSVVYEDSNIMIVNKYPGISVHSDKDDTNTTLIDLIRSRSKKYETASDPVLCHRLDRNTGGLLIVAKNTESHDAVICAMDEGEIRKSYQCLVYGLMEKPQASLRAWLFKDTKKSMVYIYNKKTIGAMEIITKYKLLEYNKTDNVSRLEVELVTGRTHQIRAHLASIGHPVIGDGKYGKNSINKMFGAKQQALWAYKLEFSIKENSLLKYLDGKVFEVSPAF